ncbi:hypothetical protein UFOVP54_186 [uncultured Caudovirales phage]|uniref:Uncharacterized protein n=1 Tax=uncultured Caudovirales phage TaxID=2100421 RepID=A0A6J5KWM1_9CAUD|nr:hypothetical protein UFOVP54_186 [uncultured Caudovirales phage]
MRPATTVETLHTLHTLWRKKQMETAQVKHLLKTSCFLELTSITNGGITADSMDGKSKYSIK